MNTTRAIINLSALRGLNQEQSSIFALFFGQKGRYFNNEKILDKLKGSLMPAEDIKEGEEPKAEKAAKGKITRALKILVDAGVIHQKEDQPASEAKEYKMQEYDIKDLGEERQLLIGGKAHTTLTSNSETVFYQGDLLLYMCHPLSPEYKAEQRIGTATLKDYHVNEEGFLYGIVTKPVMVEGEKAKNCAVKLSQAQLLDEAIPEGAKECVKYKQKASLTKPELKALPNMEKGTHLLFFNAAWSPNSLHMKQILEGLFKTKEIKGKMEMHSVNTDHQVDEGKAYNIRTCATLIVIKNGKETGRLVGMPNAEDVNKEIYNFLKKAIK